MRVSSLKKVQLAFVVLILCVSFCAMFINNQAVFAGNFNYTIVIDAGHGGKDIGSQGILSGVLESDLNLEYAKALGDKYFIYLVDRSKIGNKKYSPIIYQNPYKKIYNSDLWSKEADSWRLMLIN
ncbi:MAG: N-acetylmuramoyl-L-alanine amidase [Campylobacterales bacterium]